MQPDSVIITLTTPACGINHHQGNEGWVSRFNSDASGNPKALDTILYTMNASDPVLQYLHRYVLPPCVPLLQFSMHRFDPLKCDDFMFST